MNQRRNLQKRKHRRRRNEIWEFRGGIDAWIFREVGRDINRFAREHALEIVHDARIEAMRDIESGELVVSFNAEPIVWSRPFNPGSRSEE